MQTNRREAWMTGLRDRKLLSISCLPGHHVPGTPPQLGAAERKRIGRPVRFASARPSFKRVNHWMPPDGTAGVAAGAGTVSARAEVDRQAATSAATAAAREA